ncbi:CynX/NimT family MFS transporter [Nocardioides houyundeii]|uniref:MFS transporter n=1 Tax=Nocardioides houyundeii TaxID=2045452 RepID=UPI0013B46016|nr:MFS transporter [Nocardioides houyundeii]
MDPLLATVEAPGRVGGRRLPPWLAIALVIAIGVNIRGIFGAVPPLVPDIRADLDVSATTASLLTALTLLTMGLCAPLGHVLVTRIGADWAMISLLAVLALAELSRFLIDTPAPLVATAAVIGGALGALSTLTPGFISHHLPHLRGLATGIYSTAMALGVALAAGTAQPVAASFGGWRTALAVWGVVALLLAAALVLTHLGGAGVPDEAGVPTRLSLPLRERRAWFVTAVFAVPMFLGFSVIAWLPSLFVEAGLSAGTAAAYLVAFQCVQLFSMLTLTPLTDRFPGRRGVFATVMVTSTLGLLLLVLEPHDWAVPGLLLAGFGIGGASSLALVKVQDEAHSPQDATRLSGMAMLFSFTGGAIGPFLVGTLKDTTGSYVPGFAVCLGVSTLSLLLLVRMAPARPRPAPVDPHDFPADNRPGPGSPART